MKFLTIILAIFFTTSLYAEKTGEEVYKATCATCHMSGVANAPKVHDEVAWKAKGKDIDALVASSKKGINAMPPFGTCMTCTDGELKAAIEFMMQSKK